ncbi:MAG: hypothetical protein COU10_03095 [Candidatus Harrisonbacteria bacterium CG10_big_fil_rev_8_21_14_0_10_45_28]|uniref:DUF1648 domain-containing protein n=1 Tax=Candidatus Harrisonbacteria bacterium CG10_big_fil_rev_8_21_14_0_10_45_28 TaxID=1974586 RepID=A0A2H0UPY0_9BACT|nr:MAG: hypothetical protein COU10_03095 [Candidatus Harrisonbacteria bacterium CG10_big_fil_rev_8_21_14_0_10_45_28]
MRFIKTSLISSLAILAFTAGLAYVNLSKINGLLIVHLDQYRNVILGTPLDVFITIFLSALLVTINFGLARAFYHKENFLGVLLAISSIVLAVLILIFISAIISIN